MSSVLYRLRSLGSRAAALSLLCAVLFVSSTMAQERPMQGIRDFPDLVAGLLATDGVVGVETAQTPSGQQLIFAWFEDKAAALRWYYSETHQMVQEAFVPDRPEHTPLQHIPDDVGPIMAIASVTPADSAHFAGVPLAISQIAIELYQPLPGGVFLGSRFAPAGVKVKGMLDYTPKHP